MSTDKIKEGLWDVEKAINKQAADIAVIKKCMIFFVVLECLALLIGFISLVNK